MIVDSQGKHAAWRVFFPRYIPGYRMMNVSCPPLLLPGAVALHTSAAVPATVMFCLKYGRSVPFPTQRGPTGPGVATKRVDGGGELSGG